MCVHVHSFAGLNHTSLVPLRPHDPSGSGTNPDGFCCCKYSEQVMSSTPESGACIARATFFSQSGPSNHQCPKSLASKGAHRTGTTSSLCGASHCNTLRDMWL